MATDLEAVPAGARQAVVRAARSAAVVAADLVVAAGQVAVEGAGAEPEAATDSTLPTALGVG